MSSFLTYFQPSILRLSNDICIPKSLQNKYVLNINAMGISWFEENFFVAETDDGQTYLSANDSTLLLESSGSNKFDVPRIYIILNDDYDDNLVAQFTAKALTIPETYGNGITGFRPGKDFYVNTTLYYWLTNNHIIEDNEDCMLPDYLVQSGDTMGMSKFFQDLDINDKNCIDVNRFIKKNSILNLSWSEEKLRNLASTFFECILKYTQITNEDRVIPRNQIYQKVMEYYRDGKSDETTIALQLILGNKAKVAENWMQNTLSCNTCFNISNSSSSASLQPTCLQLYINAMQEWIKEMLGNYQFNKDWMFASDGENVYSNTSLINLLITLLQDYLNGGFPLSKSDDSDVNCNSCPSLDSSYSKDNCNKNIILNYIKVLEWTKDCKLKENKNKIKIYGQQFAELLDELFYD